MLEVGLCILVMLIAKRKPSQDKVLASYCFMQMTRVLRYRFGEPCKDVTDGLAPERLSVDVISSGKLLLACTTENSVRSEIHSSGYLVVQNGLDRACNTAESEVDWPADLHTLQWGKARGGMQTHLPKQTAKPNHRFIPQMDYKTCGCI